MHLWKVIRTSTAANSAFFNTYYSVIYEHTRSTTIKWTRLDSHRTFVVQLLLYDEIDRTLHLHRLSVKYTSVDQVQQFSL